MVGTLSRPRMLWHVILFYGVLWHVILGHVSVRLASDEQGGDMMNEEEKCKTKWGGKNDERRGKKEEEK